MFILQTRVDSLVKLVKTQMLYYFIIYMYIIQEGNASACCMKY